jgi:hypothetical protein
MSTPDFLLSELSRMIEVPLAFDDNDLCVLEVDDTVMTIRRDARTLILYGALGDCYPTDPPAFWLRMMQGNLVLMETMRAAIVLVPGTETLCLMQAIDASSIGGDTFEGTVLAFIHQTQRIVDAWDALYSGDEVEDTTLLEQIL